MLQSVDVKSSKIVDVLLLSISSILIVEIDFQISLFPSRSLNLVFLSEIPTLSKLYSEITIQV